jgi:hypothetical protein
MSSGLLGRSRGGPTTKIHLARDGHGRPLSVVLTGRNVNDCTVYRTSGIDQKLAGRPVMADGVYRGNPEVIMPLRKRADGTLTDWQEDLNAMHRKVRASVEHALAR